jgi:hypothetical protein
MSVNEITVGQILVSRKKTQEGDGGDDLVNVAA